MEHSDNTEELRTAEEVRQRKQFAKMTETPVPKLVVTLGIPTMLNMMVSSFYHLADTYFDSSNRFYVRYGRRQYHFSAFGQARPKRSG